MKIDIDLTKKQCMDILYANDYVCEDVALYYTLDTDPYDKKNPSDEWISGLKTINTKIAYEVGNKPEFLNSEYPMLDEAEDYLMDRVVNKLVNKMFVNALLANFNRK